MIIGYRLESHTQDKIPVEGITDLLFEFSAHNV
jgi:hypothetical protein